MNEEITRIHQEIMLHTQTFRMKNRTPPKVWISQDLFRELFGSYYGRHIVDKLYGWTYFGCPLEVVDAWEGMRYIVGYEGGTNQ